MLQYFFYFFNFIEGIKEGWMCEWVSIIDWLEGIGEIFYFIIWLEMVFMFIYVEILGFYVQFDWGICIFFDYVEVRS